MMSDKPMDFFQAGQLDEAVEKSLELVKKNPNDAAARYMLAQLSCIAGDLDRADRQLDTVSTQDTQTALRVALVRQLVRAELSRRECYAQGRVPEFIGEPSERMQGRLRAMAAIRDGDSAEAARIIGEDPQHTLATPVEVNGTTVNEIRDLDDFLAPLLEVHTATGKYFWIEWNQILSVEMHPPETPLDLLWRQATVSIESGPDGDVYLPAVYLEPSGRYSEEAQFRLGRGTDWVDDGDTIVRGRGQKTLLVGEQDLPIMQLETIQREE